MKGAFSKILLILILFCLYSKPVISSSLSNNSTFGEAGYFSNSINMSLDLSKETYILLNGVYIKKEGNSWAGEKLYKIGFGLRSEATSEEINYSIYKGVDDYSIYNLSLLFTANLNNIFKKKEIPVFTEDFWSNFVTSVNAGIYFALQVKGLTPPLSQMRSAPLQAPQPPLLNRTRSSEWSLSQTIFSAGLNETFYKSTIIKINSFFYSYNTDLNLVMNPVANYQYRFDELLGSISSFPSTAFSAEITQYLFDFYVYIYAGYLNASYVLTTPSNSYTAILGGFPVKGVEVYVLYNRFFDPNWEKSEYYTAGLILYF
ncbi:MAG: hypothetical protein V1752_03060 [Candidatus Firestonebacteria bacterium]